MILPRVKLTRASFDSNGSIRRSLSKVSPSLHAASTPSTALEKDLISTPSGPAVLLSTLQRAHPSHERRPSIANSVLSDSSDDEIDRSANRALPSEETRSPIAQMLWTRWVVGLKEQREFSFPSSCSL